MDRQLNPIFREQSHRRFNPLAGDWVLVSPHRTQRPWQGAVESVPPTERPQYDPTCYLCPGNIRAGGLRNPKYQSTFVFENDFAALKKDAPSAKLDLQNKGLLVAETERGVCRVICFLPRHDLTLATMHTSEIEEVVCSNDSFVALVPFWAVWPFEVLLCSRRHLGTFPELNESEIAQLSSILKQIVSTYDRVFNVPFPYSMGFHQAPFDGSDHPEWHFHAHFYPPLLRSATVRKFMVGFEMLGTPQRDITAELAAERLRSLVKPVACW